MEDREQARQERRSKFAAFPQSGGNNRYRALKLAFGIQGEVAKTPEYTCWVHMLVRCTNKKDPSFHRYGGRGIKVCASWKASFVEFYLDMGPRPSSKHSIERTNNDGDYTPENCRWATRLEQANNTSQNLVLEFAGEKKTLMQWRKQFGFKRGLIEERLKRGWSVWKAFVMPAQQELESWNPNA